MPARSSALPEAYHLGLGTCVDPTGGCEPSPPTRRAEPDEAPRRASRGRSVIGIAIALAGVASPAARAEAAARRGLVARVASPSPVGQAELEAAVAAELTAAGIEVVLAPVAAAGARRAAGAVERDKVRLFARAAELAAEGWKAYLSVEPAFAEARLGEARRVLEGVLDLDGALERLADVSLRLGAVRLYQGRKHDAQAAFALAAALDPDRDVSAQEFSPDVISAYQRARTAAAGGASATLEVASLAGATVEIDGVAAGTAPLRMGIAVGEHVVVVRAPGRVASGQIVAVGAGGAKVEIPLDEDLIGRALAGGDGAFRIGLGGAEAGTLAATVGTYAELDEIVLVGAAWRHGQPALFGQRCQVAPVRCGPVREVLFGRKDKVAAASRELVRGMQDPAGGKLPPILLEDTRLTEPEPEPKGDGGGKLPPPPPRAWWKSPWVWIGVGTAAAIATGAVLLLGDEGTTYEVVLPGCPWDPDCGP